MCLNLAADCRFSQVDIFNDHIWEVKLGGSEPAAINLQTTYGLRARGMRLYPRFIRKDITLSDPLQFHRPPALVAFYANYLRFGFSPFSGIDISLEYWVPESHAICGRIRMVNSGVSRDAFELEWVSLLNPMGEGQNMAAIQIAMTNILQGKTSNLAPVFFLTGGPIPGRSSYPSLSMDIDLAPGSERTLTWALVSLPEVDASLEQARRLTARPWEAEIARIELQNASDTIEISTGDSDWDAAFALSQKVANGLFFPSTDKVAHPTVLLSRQPDHGYSYRQDGSDHTYLWSGQTALDTYYIAKALPSQQGRLRNLLRNFLSTADAEGNLEWRISLFNTPTRRLAQPILSTLAWQLSGNPTDIEWLKEIYPPLLAFFQAWFSQTNDRDLDGFPEWSNPMQTGLENAPIYDRWHGGQGMDTTFIESPGLASLLYQEALHLVRIAHLLGNENDIPALEKKAEDLRLAIQSTWDSNSLTYHHRDAITHLIQNGERIVSFTGSGKSKLEIRTQQPQRLIVYLTVPPETTRNIQIKIYGQTRKGFATELISSRQWNWAEKQAVATSTNAFIAVRQIEISGLPPEGIGWLSTCGYTQEDCSLLLPLWAGISSNEQARQIVRITLFNHYAEQFGLPLSPSSDTSSAGLIPFVFNLLLGEGMLHYGMRRQAADLFTRWMRAIIPSLRQNQVFRASYHASTGQPSGEANALRGLIPLDFFLKTLGIRYLQSNRVILEGNNPFPWPITVKYLGMTITRHSDKTIVIFPNGQNIEVDDDQPYLITS
jgi:hypothetical protein